MRGNTRGAGQPITFDIIQRWTAAIQTEERPGRCTVSRRRGYTGGEVISAGGRAASHRRSDSNRAVRGGAGMEPVIGAAVLKSTWVLLHLPNSFCTDYVGVSRW